MGLKEHKLAKSAHIRFEKVAVHYYPKPRWLGGKPFKALKKFSLEISTKNIAIVGPSGAGKSTLIELLFGLRQASTGKVYICGHSLSKPLAKQQKKLCQHIQLIPQDPVSSLNPFYSVQEILSEPLHNLGLTQAVHEKIHQVLQDVGLNSSLLQNNSQQLSVGQAQRVAIARALIVDPCVLVADEPTSSLDPVSRKRVLDLFAQIQKKRQMRLVLVTHDLDAAQSLCDEILVLNKGEIVEHNASQEVMKNPKHFITQSLIQAQQALLISRDKNNEVSHAF